MTRRDGAIVVTGDAAAFLDAAAHGYTSRFGRPAVPMLRPAGKLPVEPAADRPAVRPTANGYAVEGVAHIEAAPHRSNRVALAMAARVALRPRTYLPLLMWFATPGVVDCREGVTNG